MIIIVIVIQGNDEWEQYSSGYLRYISTWYTIYWCGGFNLYSNNVISILCDEHSILFDKGKSKYEDEYNLRKRIERKRWKYLECFFPYKRHLSSYIPNNMNELIQYRYCMLIILGCSFLELIRTLTQPCSTKSSLRLQHFIPGKDPHRLKMVV